MLLASATLRLEAAAETPFTPGVEAPSTNAVRPAAVLTYSYTGPPKPAAQHPGRKYAEVTCATCHVVPEPGLLPRTIWSEIVLKKMSFYTGIQQLDMEKNEEADLYKASGLFPFPPLLERQAWLEIECYYLDCSPADSLPHEPRPEITVGLKHFRVETPRFRIAPPLTMLTTIDPQEKVIYAADANEQTFHVLDRTGRAQVSLPIGNIPVWLRKTESGIYLACIGHFFPKEERRGQLIRLERKPDGFERKVLASALPRPCHIEWADVNGDRKPELLLSMFGYLTGRFSWYDRLENDQPREHILFPKAGPLVSAVHDFNEDGKPDVAMLSGQEIESFQIYFGDGNGSFPHARQVFRMPPTYGHTYFELADFNKDDRPDLVVCNGDNGDYESVPKPYHGIRIWLNQGKGGFEQKIFIPIHGVFRAMARDFDQDGDLDLAAISFYPDFEKNPRESFVYLENQGDWRFQAFTFRECISGRWMTMDAGDLDGDGDLDIVLGSMVRMPSKVPDFVKNIWETTGPSVLILKNTLR